MLTLLGRLDKAVNRGDSPTELKAGKTYFLHSEPGCGKVRLAQLCHLFSQRATGTHEEVKREVESLKTRYPMNQRGKLIGDEKAQELQIAPSIEEYLKGHPSFGYTTFNSGLLNERNFGDLMFSSDFRAGALYLTHLLRGTLFLDECNTLEPRLANQLLRAFEEPYPIIVTKNGITEEEKINIQVVFGSNLSPDQLLSDGFNSAIVFRIAKQPFHIPPLRKRKVDIAIFVNWYFLDRNSKLPAPVRRISLEGLRIICELPWPDNYRGVTGLLDDILQTRDMRGVKEREVSFDEVIQAVARREVMGRGARSETIGHSFSGTIR